MNNDLCRTGRVLAMPPTRRFGAWKRTFRKSLATTNEQGNQTCACNADKTARINKGGYLSAFS